MVKTSPKQPVLILLYGFPGAGKTHFARKACETLNATFISGDRIRNELFETPRYDKTENTVVAHLMEYMTEEFLKAGVPVVLDVDARRASFRRRLSELAAKQHAKTLIAWFQIDAETAFARLGTRDRRRSEDKFAKPMNRSDFDAYVASMQHPSDKESFVVLSGKHSFLMQYSGLLRKLFDMNLVNTEDIAAHVVKPELMNLIPAKHNSSHTNIRIR
jgi:predicted kinase